VRLHTSQLGHITLETGVEENLRYNAGKPKRFRNMYYLRNPRIACSCLLLSLATFWTSSFNAMAVVDANSASNTIAPSDGAPWNNVGNVNGASGVYLGGGWVVTAAHVGPGNINFAGTIFTYDGTSLRLTNSDGTPTDLNLFHLSTLPALPSVSLVSTTPAAFSQIDLIGFGYTAGSAQTNFGLYSGFYWSANTEKGWGNNKVNLGGTTTFDIGSGTVTAFITDFTAPGTLGPTSQTSDEAQIAVGDSGGGAFQKNGSGNWQASWMPNRIRSTRQHQPLCMGTNRTWQTWPRIETKSLPFSLRAQSRAYR